MHNHSVTTWENPTKHIQRFEIHHGPGSDPEKFEVPPGGKAQVLSLYDNAIRTVRDGVVVGGLAPLLVPEGRTTVPVHEAIAKAAAMGDTERKVVAATGVSAGASSLDAVVALEVKNAELERKLETLMAMLAERTAPVEKVLDEPTAKPAPGQQQGAPRKG
jgi:hypothetical protein